MTVCGDGTADYEEIQAALDAAPVDAVIEVCSGRFEPVALSRGVTLRGAGRTETIVVGTSTDSALTVDVNEGIVVESIGFEGHLEVEGGSAIWVRGGGVSFTDVRVADGTALEDPYTSGAHILLEDGETTFEDLLVENNLAGPAQRLIELQGYTILRHSVVRDNPADPVQPLTLIDSGSGEISNNLFTGNTGASSFWGDTVVYNNLWYGDNAVSGGFTVQANGTFQNNLIADCQYCASLSGSSADYNVIDGRYDAESAWSLADAGSHNLRTDSLMNDPASGDYTFSIFSVCIDGGNPAAEYNDVDGTVNDIGLFGGPGGSW